jgi:hypothetical protein
MFTRSDVMRVTNSIPLGRPLPLTISIMNCVETRKDSSAAAKRSRDFRAQRIAVAEAADAAVARAADAAAARAAADMRQFRVR